MYIVRGAAAAAAPAAAMRVPQAPQKANPGATMRPQLGQTVPSTAGAVGACSTGCAAGVDVGRDAAQVPTSVLAPGDDVTGGGVTEPSVPDATPPPLWVGVMGIFGESFQGIPPFCFPAEGGLNVGSGVGSLPRLPAFGLRSGGSIVRAVSSGAGSLVAALGAGLISLPHPRQNL